MPEGRETIVMGLLLAGNGTVIGRKFQRMG